MARFCLRTVEKHADEFEVEIAPAKLGWADSNIQLRTGVVQPERLYKFHVRHTAYAVRDGLFTSWRVYRTVERQPDEFGIEIAPAKSGSLQSLFT